MLQNFSLMDAAFVAGSAYRVGDFDIDAAAYIAAVEAADGQALEAGVRTAINAFVVGCKADGIWNAIKASCIMAGARTLAGALTPLVGTAPTNFNFVSGDYNRKTGLIGNGSTKYLNSNRNNNADPQNSNHNAAWVSTIGNPGAVMAALATTGTDGFNSLSDGAARNRNSTPYFNTSAPGFIGTSRSSASSFVYRNNSTSLTVNGASLAPGGGDILIFSFSAGSGSNVSNHRIAFYSIGEALDLALLDARVTTLVNAFAAAIP